MKKLLFSKYIKITGSLIVLLIFSGFLLGDGDIFFKLSKNIDLFTKVYKELTLNYVDDISPDELMRSGIRGMLGSLDPYTVFIDETKQEDIDALTLGKYGGVGISVGLRENRITILDIIPGYSAFKQGIQIGDIILKVDSVEVNNGNYADISSFIKGVPGSRVQLKILRGIKDTIDFALMREEIIVKNISYAGFYPAGSSTVYIKLTNFSRGAGEELRATINRLMKEKNIERVIFDLRGNPGGLLDAAVDITNKFIKKGDLIVSTKGRDSSSLKQYFADQEPMLPDARMVVLVDDGTASAAEIVSGAIQDHDRGVILGERSFGKGLVQTVLPLSYNTSLKLTTAKYFTPSGRCIQKINYTKNNKVFERSDSLLKGTFKTDNNRTVYSSGGILPDTVVLYPEPHALVRDILAKGLIFSFCNVYYRTIEKEGAVKATDKQLFSDFVVYLQEQKYEFLPEIASKMNEILLLSEKDEKYSALKDEIQKLKSELVKRGKEKVETESVALLEQIKIELAARFLGGEARIAESLQYDPQVKIALDVLNNLSVYNNMLKK